jgi:hypothetical protein
MPKYDLISGARAIAAAIVLIPATTAFATIALPPAGDTLLNGAFINLSYGNSGTAALSPLLFVGELANTLPPDTQVATTNLSYGYNLTGSGTPLFSVTYSITNIDILPFSDLRFMIVAQPDGGARRPIPSELDQASEGGFALPKAPGDADKRELFSRSPATFLVNKTASGNGVADGANNCAPAGCNLDMALEWDLAVLNPNETWKIKVNLTDDPNVAATRCVRATSVGPADSVLTLTGNAELVPEPSTYAMLVAALGLMGFAGYYRRRGER